jgi:3',5'-cyclic AMP phosphodiesterase CpdA
LTISRFAPLAGVLALMAICQSAQASTTKPLPPLPLPAHAVAPPAALGSFTFVAGGDNRPTTHGEPMPPSTDEIFKEIGLIRPPFVIWTGDEIEGYDDTPAEADAEYKDFLGLAADAQTPIYGIPGNHEISFDPALQAVYTRDMGPLYGSFDYDGSHFIGLDSTPIESDGKIHEGTIDPDQLAWLKADLAANQDAANIFVFFHHYMYGLQDPDSTKPSDTGFGDPAERDAMHQLFLQYHVRAVFNGHSHMSYHIQKDGIDYYIAGNAGAPMDAAPEDGGYLGYMLVTVVGSNVTARNLMPWTLFTRTISGNDGKSSTAQIAVSAFCYGNIDLGGVTVSMPPAASYTATAVTRYKGKAPPAPVTVASVVPGPGNTSLVTLDVPAKAARTTYVTVTAVGTK